jgi:hypothetical protein
VTFSKIRQFEGNFVETPDSSDRVDEFRRKVVALYIELFHRTRPARTHLQSTVM